MDSWEQQQEVIAEEGHCACKAAARAVSLPQSAVVFAAMIVFREDATSYAAYEEGCRGHPSSMVAGVVELHRWRDYVLSAYLRKARAGVEAILRKKKKRGGTKNRKRGAEAVELVECGSGKA